MNSIKDLLSVKGMVLCIFSQRCDTVQSPERFSFQCTEDFNTHFSGALVKNQYFFPLSKINYFKWPLRIAKKCTWLLKVKRITWPSKMSRKSPPDSTQQCPSRESGSNNVNFPQFCYTCQLWTKENMFLSGFLTLPVFTRQVIARKTSAAKI